jgi:uracil-DNA glycosylase
MTPDERLAGLREVAQGLDRIDTAVYQKWDKDPLHPVLGGGDPQARVCFFGRDPGRDEVRWQTPFIGAGGQKIRKGLYSALYQADLPDFQASLDVGAYAFWANTVPFKPVGNKAWPMSAQRATQPFIADLLVNGWSGEDIITLGRVAFFWFGLAGTREDRKALSNFWAREDRFTMPFETVLTAPCGQSRSLRVHPLPHPSPLNATWYKRFPGLLLEKLEALGMTRDGWRISPMISGR